MAWWATGLAFLLLLAAVVHGTTTDWDSAVTTAVVAGRTPAMTRVALAASWLGSAVPLAIWAGTSAFVLDRRYGSRWRCSLRVLLVLLLDVVVVFAIKNLVDRPRPPSEHWLASVSTFSFPSGHTTATTAAVSMLLLCVAALPTSRRARACAVTAGLLLVLAVGWSRVYLGVHYLSDVAAGNGPGCLADAVDVVGPRLGPALAPVSTGPRTPLTSC